MKAQFKFMRENQMWDQPLVDIYFVTINDNTEPTYEVEVTKDGKIHNVGEFTDDLGERLFVTASVKNELQTLFDDYKESA